MPTRHLPRLAVLLLTLLPLREAMAWGVYGHEAVGAIADRLLNPVASKRVAELLDGETLATVSIWPDCLKYPDLQACARQLPQHAVQWFPLYAQSGGRHAQAHFTDVDIGQAAYSGPEGDVVHVLPQLIGVLQGNTAVPNPWHVQPGPALWFVVHLVGDIHQPLHVGVIAIDGNVKATAGGTRLYPEPDTCLHTLWDDGYVEAAMKSAGAADNPWAYAGWLADQHWPAPQDAADPLARPVQWATDTLGVARDVALKDVVIGAAAQGDCGFHKPQAGWSVTLPAGYGQRAEQTVDRQIWKAGARLAALLNDIWPAGDAVTGPATAPAAAN